MSAYRYAYSGTPAAAGVALVEYAVYRAIIRPRGAIKGETLRSWATDGDPPLWSARAAAQWLQEHDYCPKDERQRRAVEAAAEA
ncbi:MAG: hypothetical protein ABW168_05695 [Sedimenticola sp.]